MMDRFYLGSSRPKQSMEVQEQEEEDEEEEVEVNLVEDLEQKLISLAQETTIYFDQYLKEKHMDVKTV